MEGEGETEIEREREIEERRKVTEITENTQRKKSAQRNAHTEESQRKAEGKFKRAQTLRETLETKKREKRKAAGRMWEARRMGYRRKSLERKT